MHVLTQANTDQQQGSPLMTYLMFGAIALLLVFMFINTNRRRKTMLAQQKGITEGSLVRSAAGIIGVVTALDAERDEAIVETTPGTKLRIMRQALMVLQSPEERAAAESLAYDGEAEAPHFTAEGKRIDGASVADEGKTAAAARDEASDEYDRRFDEITKHEGVDGDARRPGDEPEPRV